MQRLGAFRRAARDAKCTKSIGNSVKNILNLCLASWARILTWLQQNCQPTVTAFVTVSVRNLKRRWRRNCTSAVHVTAHCGKYVEQWRLSRALRLIEAPDILDKQTEDSVSNRCTNQSEMHADSDRRAHANVECGENVSRDRRDLYGLCRILQTVVIFIIHRIRSSMHA